MPAHLCGERAPLKYGQLERALGGRRWKEPETLSEETTPGLALGPADVQQERLQELWLRAEACLLPSPVGSSSESPAPRGRVLPPEVFQARACRFAGISHPPPNMLPPVCRLCSPFPCMLCRPNRDVSTVEVLMNYHQGLKSEIETRNKNVAACVDLGKTLVLHKSPASEEVRSPPPGPSGGWATRERLAPVCLG